MYKALWQKPRAEMGKLVLMVTTRTDRVQNVRSKETGEIVKIGTEAQRKQIYVAWLRNDNRQDLLSNDNNEN